MRKKIKSSMQLLLITVLLGGTVTYGQDNGRVTGSVTDETNKVLQGVSVAIKTSGKATVTDANGKFSIAVQTVMYYYLPIPGLLCRKLQCREVK
ncbi:MAG: carboxypeptidase-like regulatory domain-containing protein [Chitinophagaceae bacterium]